MPQAQHHFRRAIVLAGPTASGKSALAVSLAERHNGVIINADSMQVYAGIPILTAAPSAAEMQRVPHSLYGMIDPAIPCSVAIWLEAAQKAAEEAWHQGKLPIFVGGTGLYIRALLQGLSPIPDVSESIREAVRALPTAEAYAWLGQHDPAMAAKLEAGDSQRIARAVEVLRETGHSLLYWQAITPQPPIADAVFELYSLTLPRELLYQRCDQRLEVMLEQGALDELRALLARNLPADMPAMRAVGIPELAQHLRGEWTREHALSKAQQATRNYAKRQLTWLRNQFPDAVQIVYPYAHLPTALL